MALNGSFVCYLIFQLPYTSAVSYARLPKTCISFFRMIRRLHQTQDNTSYEYHVPSIVQHCCCRCSLHQVTRLYSYKEKGDAVRIEPTPPSPSTCRLCARSSRTLFRPQASGDGHPDAERARRVEGMVSAH